MNARLEFRILPQPDDTTCGPTCLQAVYQYYGDQIDLRDVIAQIERLDDGGTLAVFLGRHALKRGYQATIYTYNLRIFDPTWFDWPDVNIREKLVAQLQYKKNPKLQRATRGYLDFIEQGGRLKMEDLSPSLMRKYLNRGIPILTGLSATYLYRTPREYGPQCEFDDVRGVSSGHFVVLCGYDRSAKQILVADPLKISPLNNSQIYAAPFNRLITALLLGVLTYDANFLIIEPVGRPRRPPVSGKTP